MRQVGEQILALPVMRTLAKLRDLKTLEIIPYHAHTEPWKSDCLPDVNSRAEDEDDDICDLISRKLKIATEILEAALRPAVTAPKEAGNK